MATSQQARILPGAVARVYVANGAVTLGAIVDHDGANATVSVASSGAGYGIAANDAADGEDVYVVVFGAAYLKFAGTVAANGSIVATTAGSGTAAGSSADSKILCTPDKKAGAGYVSGDIGFVIVGNLHTTAA